MTRHLRYRLVVLATGSRYLSSHFKEDWSSFDPHLYLPGGPGVKKGKMLRTPSSRTAERPASKGNRDDRCAVRTTATRRHESRVRGYRSKEEDTKNRRRRKRREEKTKKERERETDRDDRIRRERRETMKEGEVHARRKSGPSEIWFCISDILPAEIMH